MKSSIRNLLAGALMAMGTQTVWAQASDTATADATVTVVTPLTVQKNTDLNFGTVVRPQTGVFVEAEISANGAQEGDATFVGGDATAATFTVSGQGTLAYAPTVSFQSLDTFAEYGMELTPVIRAMCGNSPPQSNSDASLTLSPCALTNGTSDVTVGAGLVVFSASEGTFTNGAVSLGTITVVVAYN